MIDSTFFACRGALLSFSVLPLVWALGSGCSCTAPVLDGDGGLDAGSSDAGDAPPRADAPFDGGPDFDAGEVLDGGALDAGAGLDAAPDFDGGTPDAPSVPTDAGPGCGTLPTNPTDVYVDGLAAGAEVGTMACPFHTILGALGLPAPVAVTRTVHVRGAAGGLFYAESTTVIVPASIVLEGDGRALVRIAATTPANCILSSRCMVEVRGGGVLRGVSVLPVPGGLPGTADGVALTMASVSPPLVEDVDSSGHGGNGFHLAAGATLRGVTANGSLNGLVADAGTSSLTVDSLGSTSSVFNLNRSHGVRVNAGIATLRGCTASNNGEVGIALLASGDGGLLSHSITSCTANSNGLSSSGSSGVAAGIHVGLGASASITGCTVLANGSAGLAFIRSTSPATSISISCNVFAVPGTPSMNNGRAGLCVENTGATSSMPFRLNVFTTSTPACPSTQREMSAEETCLGALVPGYSDLVYQRGSAGGANPFAPVSCDYCP